MALISLFLPPAGIVGAFRLGKPNSVWAKLFYKRDRLRASKKRYAGSRGEPFWRRRGELLARLQH